MFSYVLLGLQIGSHHATKQLRYRQTPGIAIFLNNILNDLFGQNSISEFVENFREPLATSE
jgi:hypothetical protein